METLLVKPPGRKELMKLVVEVEEINIAPTVPTPISQSKVQGPAFDKLESAKGYLEAARQEKLAEVAESEAIYAAMPDKNAFTAQYFKLWIEYKKDELNEY